MKKTITLLIALILIIVSTFASRHSKAEPDSNSANIPKSEVSQQENENSVSESDSLALVAIYEALHGDRWEDHTNWLEGPVNTWYGITVTDNRVTSIHLQNNGLYGEIPGEIGELSYLKTLKIYNNDISGAIPSEIGDMDSLEILHISDNELDSPLPTEIGNASELVEIRLYNNQITGELPAEIGNLSNLSMLFLSSNNLTGTIPPELGALPNITYLNLGRNNLIGAVPQEIANITALTNLNIETNQLDSLPDLSALSNLTHCHVEKNRFDFGDLEIASIGAANFYYSNQKQVPVQVTEYNEELVFKCLAEGSNNSYQWYNIDTPITGETSDTLSISLTEEGIYYCKITDASYPNLTLTTKPQATGSHELINGIMADEYSALIALYDKTQGENWRSKRYWKSDLEVACWERVVVDGVHVTELKISNNRLKDSIPPEIAAFSHLITLDLNGNDMTGNIPTEIWQLTNLEYLNLGRNHLTGTISTEIGNLTQLRALHLHYNQFEGTLPNEITNASGLTSLTVGTNHFVDFPDVSGLTALDYLRIENNKLTFEDIEPNVGITSSFYYSPQDKTGSVQQYSPATGDEVNLSVSVGGINNSYQWYKDSTAISGATSSILTISSYSPDTAGVYYCETTNSTAPKLTLESHNIYLGTSIEEFAIEVQVAPEEAGTIEGAGLYEDSETVTLTASPNADYYFYRWEEAGDGEDISEDSLLSFVVSSDRSFVARFMEKRTYSISASVIPENSGTVTGTDIYHEDDQATLTASPSEGYQFTEWKVNDSVVSTDTSYQWIVNSDRHVTAHFEQATNAIHDPEMKPIILYPNPAKDHISLKGLEGTAEMYVYTTTGILLKHEYVTNGTLTVSHLPAGTYYIQLIQNQDTLFKKLLIKQ